MEVQADDGSAVSGPAISTFTTTYSEKTKNRASNIKLAAAAINNAVIKPGETFSFNDTVGPTSKANGYKKATVFFNKKKSEGYGGGVCQVSSTLFNAAEAAGLEIVERHTHSLDVTYVEEGRDATTSHRGNLDLKLKNVSGEPITIIARAADGAMTVDIY